MKSDLIHILILLTGIFYSCQIAPKAIEIPEPLAQSTAAAVGLSEEKLSEIAKIVEAELDSQHLVGMEVLVMREGKIAYQQQFGYAKLETKEPLGPGRIYRLASMTKPVTAVAALILMEEQQFELDDPISNIIPEFEHLSVLDSIKPSGEYTTVAAKREVSFRDLFTHTSGIGYLFIHEKVREIYQNAGVIDAWTINPADTLKHSMMGLTQTPLLHQPGEKFTYGLSIDLIGFLVEKMSGQSLDVFMKERIFDPLGMDDTYFYLPEEKYNRLLPVYGQDTAGVLQPAYLVDETVRGDWRYSYQEDDLMTEEELNEGAAKMLNFPINGSNYFSGGGGLSSTIEDYARFEEMLTNGGELMGTRILQAETVKLLSTNQYKEDNPFGLAVYVTEADSSATYPEEVGRFGWGGYFSTQAFSDPSEHLTVVLMSQHNPAWYMGRIFDQCTEVIYEAIVREDQHSL